MSKLRSINTAFWSDTWVEDLEPQLKLLFLYLVTNEKTNMLGIYEASKKKISFETGLDLETISNGLKAFESVNKVKYKKNHIILVNYIKHQKYNTNMKKSAIDIYNSLPNDLKDSTLNISKSNPLKGFESLLNHYGMVRKVEVEVEVEGEIEKEDKNKDFFKCCLSSLEWINTLSMQNKITNKSALEFLNTFNIHLNLTEDYKSNLKDYKTHFVNWLPKQKLNKRISDISKSQKKNITF